MDVTEALRGEHGALYSLFDAFEALLMEEGTGDKGRVASVLARSLRPVLRSHARVEDELLFELVVKEGTEQAGPAQAMLEEHEEVAELLALVEAEEDPAAARARLLDVLDRAREHFRKEELVAFPAAARALGSARLAELGEEWAVRRDVRGGRGVAEDAGGRSSRRG